MTDQSFIIKRDWVPRMAELLTSLVDEASPPFDAVHADQLWMAPYALYAKRRQLGSTNLVTVLDQHNAVYLIPQRLAESEPNRAKRALLRRETRKLSQFEAQICSEVDQLVWVTDEDRSAVLQVTDGAGVASIEASPTIPICVDCDDMSVIPPSSNPFRVTFLGGLHWPPNAAGIQWFVSEVWERIAAEQPSAQLTVIGKDPPTALVSAAEGSSSIEITGYVDDPTPYLAATAAFIVPLHAGGGMRVKILDAWRWGLPVVSTSIGAEGISIDDGENILIADDARSFADAVLSVLHNETIARHLREEGRRSAERNYDWRSVYRAWDEIYQPERSYEDPLYRALRTELDTSPAI